MFILCPFDSLRGRDLEMSGKKKVKYNGDVLLKPLHTVSVSVLFCSFHHQFFPALWQLSLTPLSFCHPPRAHQLLFHHHPFLPVSPSSPSLFIVPLLHRSSHSAPVFVEEPVKVGPTAVQTLMAPLCVLMTLVSFQLIFVSHYQTYPLLSPWHPEKRLQNKKDKGGIWGEMKRKEGYREQGYEMKKS